MATTGGEGSLSQIPCTEVVEFSFLVNKGTRLLSFDNPQILQSAVVSSAWAGDFKTEGDTVLFNSNSPLNYIDIHNSLSRSAHSYKGLNQYQILRDTDHILHEASFVVCQARLYLLISTN